jgi:hypothetical protein
VGDDLIDLDIDRNFHIQCFEKCGAPRAKPVAPTLRPGGATSRPKAGPFIHGQRPWLSAAGVNESQILQAFNQFIPTLLGDGNYR